MNSRARVPPHIIWIVAASVLLLPAAARADAGIPMLPIAYPVVLLFLVPVIGIEVFYLRIRLRTGWWKTIKAASIVNAVTLLLGYPLAWVASFVIELLLAVIVFLMVKAGWGRIIGDKIYWLSVLSPAWLGPVQSLWPILVAFVVLLVPAFLLSGFVESWMVESYDLLGGSSPQGPSLTGLFKSEECLPGLDRATKRAVWQANLLSYIFLAAAGCLTLYFRFRHFDHTQ